MKTIEYRNQFDHEFCDYLLNIDQKYGRIPFRINVKLIEWQSYEEFSTKFLGILCCLKYKPKFCKKLLF